MARLHFVLILAFSVSALGQNNVQNNADAIVQRSVEANKHDWEAASETLAEAKLKPMKP
jgi:hypothetical protein